MEMIMVPSWQVPAAFAVGMAAGVFACVVAFLILLVV
jgi:hypothetical protein